MSYWIEENRAKIKQNDFYNKKVVHEKRFELYDYLFDRESLRDKEITYLEFGVGRGNSMRWWTQNNINPNSNFWGFDTFEGLPEKYGTYKVGAFSLKGKYPDIKDERISFIKGLFQDILLNVLPQIDVNRTTIIHLDADLYSSTIFCLTILYPKLKKGDIIIFDEFVVPYHEFKAFDDFINSFNITLEPIGAINNYLQIIFEVTEIGNNASK
ncbi:MAG TPA: TylF/MycF/NovP-related O-methyltransferase [Balneolales bacterium]|nr:TylF/MycF/NovP-related O-methyltransferase [Balneolales bacterium]